MIVYTSVLDPEIPLPELLIERNSFSDFGSFKNVLKSQVQNFKNIFYTKVEEINQSKTKSELIGFIDFKKFKSISSLYYS